MAHGVVSQSFDGQLRAYADNVLEAALRDALHARGFLRHGVLAALTDLDDAAFASLIEDIVDRKATSGDVQGLRLLVVSASGLAAKQRRVSSPWAWLRTSCTSTCSASPSATLSTMS